MAGNTSRRKKEQKWKRCAAGTANGNRIVHGTEKADGSVQRG